VREASNREMVMDWWVSPWEGGTVTAAVRNASGTMAILASEAGGPSQGRTGEAAACLSVGVKERGEKGNGTAADGF
jgi:hypothetical protein